MKKKIIILSMALMLLMVGVVSAAANWGKFEGYSIVRLVVDGKTIKATDTPAVLLKGRTMVPIYMLKEAGINAEWDGETYTVSVKSPVQKQVKQFDPTEATKKIINLGGIGVTIMNISNETTAIVHYEQNKGFDSDWPRIDDIFKVLIDFNASYSRVEYGINGNVQGSVEIKTQNYKDFMNGIIDEDRINGLWILSGPMFTINNNTNQGNSNSGNNIVNTYPELYSNDLKTYLGKLTTNQYDTDSIFNTYGNYGSKYSTDSIWNQYGTYGSQYSSESAFNKYSSSPPAIVLDGEVIGYVTINTTISHGISPNDLKEFLEGLGY